MISNERHWPQHRQPYHQPHYPPKPMSPEDTLREGHLDIEQKSFMLKLKENPRGRFLRITEDVRGRRNGIIIPSTGLAEFQKLLAEMLASSETIPAKNSPANP